MLCTHYRSEAGICPVCIAVLRESRLASAVATSCQLGFGKQSSVLHRCDDNCTVRAIPEPQALAQVAPITARLKGQRIAYRTQGSDGGEGFTTAGPRSPSDYPHRDATHQKRWTNSCPCCSGVNSPKTVFSDTELPRCCASNSASSVPEMAGKDMSP